MFVEVALPAYVGARMFRRLAAESPEAVIGVIRHLAREARVHGHHDVATRLHALADTILRDAAERNPWHASR